MTIDSEMAAVILGVTRRQVQILVREGMIANVGERRRILLDLDEVSSLAAKTREA